MGYKYISKVAITPSVIMVVPLGDKGEELDGDWYTFDRETGKEVPYGIDEMIENEEYEQIYDPPEKYVYKRKNKSIWYR